MKRFVSLFAVVLVSVALGSTVLVALPATAEKAVPRLQSDAPYNFMGQQYESEAAFRADFARRGARCALDDPPKVVAELVELALEPAIDQMRDEDVDRATAAATVARPFNIPVAWHVIHDGNLGLLSSADVNTQIAVLNTAFASSRISFTLQSLDFTNNPNWFYMEPGTVAEAQAKAALNVDPFTTLNVYSVQTSFLGWATFPWNLAGNPDDDGIVVLWASLPGGPAVPYDEGDTATHEIGHWLGLFHTFQGGCAAPGDFVRDTAPEASPAFGCPVGRDTCPGGGPDPITNFMDYVDDFCMIEFTRGQKLRMHAAKQTYRPLL